jgi:hypothetical protein
LTSSSTSTSNRERLLRFARRADALCRPEQDAKLAKATEILRKLLKDGFNTIVFCRFIPTAEYVAEQLRAALPKDVEIAAVTGMLPPAEREARVAGLGAQPRRVLVATDCLSEGINLQEHFDAVLHYDLSWNPTRHEQREGRVDRYGQPKRVVRTVTYYGIDNQIDGIVLQVLLRKHQSIRHSLGISVPVPASSSDVVQALLNGLLLRGDNEPAGQMAFAFVVDDIAKDLALKWDAVSEREKRSRTLFAQHTLDVTEVAKEWQAVRQAIGAGVDVERFVGDAVRLHGGAVARKNGSLDVHLPNKTALREACGNVEGFTACFELPAADSAIYLTRTHPLVEGLATYTLDSALDPLLDGPARRCGAIRTRVVLQTTTLLLLRFRYHIAVQQPGGEGKATGRGEVTSPLPAPLLAESCQAVGFRGRPASPVWLAAAEVEELLKAHPDADVAPQQATQFVARVLEAMSDLAEPLNDIARRQADELLAAHQRVRSAVRLAGVRYDVQPQLPPDVLGIFVLLPTT